ncbi:MAG: hypothetical protein LBR73_09420 [Oscillospiraceae bacterium]|nr:hypothetical protein [Oscillospiraceae bacterium]
MPTNTLTFATYNISGLPFDIKEKIPESVPPGGTPAERPDKTRWRLPWLDAYRIGHQMDAQDLSFFAVQEDFSVYRFLAAAAKSYSYRTFSSGAVPGGDGLDIFSRLPIWNVERVAWKEAYGGIFYGAADELTPKGFLYCLMEVAPSTYIHIYNLHSDADGGEENAATLTQVTDSCKARHAQFFQLTEHIHTVCRNEAVILCGDFNSYLTAPPHQVRELLMEPNGLQDVWEEAGTGMPDCIDRILYRSGKGFQLTLQEYAPLEGFTAKGDRKFSDHVPYRVRFSYNAELSLPRQKLAPAPEAQKVKLRRAAHHTKLDFKKLTAELKEKLGKQPPAANT